MSLLLSPLRLRNLELRNRIGLSPMCMYHCGDTDGVVGPWHAVHYGQFALGGVGLVVTEATAVTPEGRVTPHDAGLWSEGHVPAWRTVTDAVHAAGGAIAVQLAHAGRKASKHRALPGDPASDRGTVPSGAGGWTTVGATSEPFGRQAPPTPATDADLRNVVQAFAAAAARAVRAGFDAVELHGAHGYLLHELLSPVTNTRTDAWGSDRTGRERLLLETVSAVREAVGDGVPVLVRLSVDDVADGGLTAADSADLAVRLRERGADLIDCSSGGLVAGAEYAPTPGYQVPGAARVRSAGVPTAAVGLITEAAHAEEILVRGDADLVLLGRALLRDPHWARAAALELDGDQGEPRYHRAYGPVRVTGGQGDHTGAQVRSA